MPQDKLSSDAIESCLSLWRERAFIHYKRKDITPRELSVMFQQKVIYILFIELN